MQRFEGIIKDVFPGIEPIDVSYEHIEIALKEACEDLNLQFIPRQVRFKFFPFLIEKFNLFAISSFFAHYCV